jgi:hypothetical protein
MHSPIHHRWFTGILILMALVLSACQAAAPSAAPAAPTAQAATQAMPTAPPTATNLPAATATFTVPAPTLTLPPTKPPAKPTETLPPAITPLPGMALYTHPKLADHIFQVEDKEWMLDPYFYGDPEFHFLRHRTLTNCRIVPTQGRGGRENVITLNIGLYSWEILFYKQGNPYQPALGGPLAITFYNYTQKNCETAINWVLKNLVYEKDAEKNPGYQQYQTPVPIPTVAGFTCGSAGPAYFKAGDRVRLLTDAVWLRSAANQDEASKVTRLTREKDWKIEVTGGPECFRNPQKGDRIFWQVQVNLPGEAEQAGWLAQGDGYEPYIVAVEK